LWAAVLLQQIEKRFISKVLNSSSRACHVSSSKCTFLPGN
jgi:hypothetical protein